MGHPPDLASMPLDPAGLPTAVADLADAEDRAAIEAEQADLFASSPIFGGEAGAVLRRTGRPPGAQNRATAAWRDYVLRHYRSPLLYLADLAAADPFELHAAIVQADLAAKLERSVSVQAIIALQRAAAADLAGYLHRRQPLAIDGGEDKPLPSITMLQVAGAALFGAEEAQAHGPQGLGVTGPDGDEPEVAGVEVARGSDAG